MVQLSDTLKTALISGDDGPLCETIESWEATAEVMSSPEMLAALEQSVDEREYVSLERESGETARPEASGNPALAELLLKLVSGEVASVIPAELGEYSGVAHFTAQPGGDGTIHGTWVCTDSHMESLLVDRGFQWVGQRDTWKDFDKLIALDQNDGDSADTAAGEIISTLEDVYGIDVSNLYFMVES